MELLTATYTKRMKDKFICAFSGAITGAVITYLLLQAPSPDLRKDPVCEWAMHTIDSVNFLKERKRFAGENSMPGGESVRD